MKFKISLAICLLGVASTSIAQDFISGQGSSSEPATSERVTVEVQSNFDNRKKSQSEIESEVIRYLAVQLTDSNMSEDLKAFLELDSNQVNEILMIVEPVEKQFLELELERLQVMCESWSNSGRLASEDEALEETLNAYDLKLRQQGDEPSALYSNAISAISDVVGSEKSEEWNEYLIVQREMMSRMKTTYFHQNVLTSGNISASIEANCGGR